MHKPSFDKQISSALVTGASSGIGMALCRLLAAKKIPLLITGRDINHLNTIADELSKLVQVTVIVADLSRENDRAALIKQIQMHQPNLIVNSAGFGLYGEALNYDTAEQMGIMNVNAAALLELTLESARMLKDAGKEGVIMNISSAADSLVFPLLAVYSASKAFVTQFSRSFDYEMRPHGIAILVASPGVVKTQFRIRASGGKAKTQGYWTMTPEFAAEELWRQIESRKQVHIFDWKTRLGIALSHLLPTKLVSKLLMRTVRRL